jgi:hypothetical protein
MHYLLDIIYEHVLLKKFSLCFMTAAEEQYFLFPSPAFIFSKGKQKARAVGSSPHHTQIEKYAFFRPAGHGGIDFYRTI